MFSQVGLTTEVAGSMLVGLIFLITFITLVITVSMTVIRLILIFGGLGLVGAGYLLGGNDGFVMIAVGCIGFYLGAEFS